MEFLKTKKGKILAGAGLLVLLAIMVYFGVDADVAANLNQ